MYTPKFDGSLSVFEIIKSRQNDKQSIRKELAKLFDHLKTIHFGHANISDH